MKEGERAETILQNMKTQLYLSRGIGIFLHSLFLCLHKFLLIPWLDKTEVVVSEKIPQDFENINTDAPIWLERRSFDVAY